MIIEKLYRYEPREDAVEKIDESDLSCIKALTEKYGAIEIFEDINERRKDRDYNTEYHPRVSGEFDKTGGSHVRGIGGAIQSIPSFAITALISPALAALAGVGALSYRIRRRWEDKESWRNRLMPGFWADNLANPGNYSIPHRVVSGTGKVAKGAGVVLAAGVLGPLAWPKLKERYNEMKENSPSWLKKLIGIGTAAGVGKAYMDGKSNDSSTGSPSDSSVYFDEDLTLTPNEVKNIDFKEYYITLSNGEIVRVKADSEQSAKLLGKKIVEVGLLAGTWYEALNNEIRRGVYKRFEFYFDDGEMCYSAGRNEDEAKNAAKEYRTKLCNLINDSDKNLMPIDPLIAPKIYGKSNPMMNKEIPLPDRNRMTVSLIQPPKKEFKKQALKYPVYAYGDLKDFGVRTMNSKIHFPATSINEAEEMVRRFYRDAFVIRDMKNIEKNRTHKQFRVTMGDRDSYYVYAVNDIEAEKTAKEIQKAKLKSAESVLRKNNVYDIFAQFLSEYKTEITKVTKITPIQIKDYKPLTIDGKVQITKNPSSEDERKDIYQAYTLR